MKVTREHEAAMALALAEAELAFVGGDVPVGAVVLDQHGSVVAGGFNRRELDQDPTAHAEIVALRQAARVLGTWRLDRCTLAVTLEPCPMCAGAIVLARVRTLLIGADDPKAGAVGSVWDIVRDPRQNHRPEVVVGVLAERASAQIRGFFESQRGRG